VDRCIVSNERLCISKEPDFFDDGPVIKQAPSYYTIRCYVIMLSIEDVPYLSTHRHKPNILVPHSHYMVAKMAFPADHVAPTIKTIYISPARARAVSKPTPPTKVRGTDSHRCPIEENTYPLVLCSKSEEYPISTRCFPGNGCCSRCADRRLSSQ
jgi:hypothetical protein